MTGKNVGGSRPENGSNHTVRKLRDLGLHQQRPVLRSILSMGAISAVVASVFIGGGAYATTKSDATGQAVESASILDESAPASSAAPSEEPEESTLDSTKLAAPSTSAVRPSESESDPGNQQAQETNASAQVTEPSEMPKTQPEAVEPSEPTAAAPKSKSGTSVKNPVEPSEEPAAEKLQTTSTAKEPEPAAKSEAPASEPAKEPAVQFLAPAAIVGGFEIDGNYSSNGGLDWGNVVHGIGDDGYDAADSSQLSGKENEPEKWALESPTAPDKADIGVVRTYSQLIGGSEYFYLAFQRQGDQGSTYFNVELNQITTPEGELAPIRSDGDILISFVQDGNVMAALGYRTWLDGSWNSTQVVPDGAIESALNATAVDGFDARTFLEASFNLNLLDQSTSCTRGSFTEVSIRSRTSPSLSSELADIAWAEVNIPPRCADIDIEKRNEAGELVPGATFKVTPNPLTGTGALTLTDGDNNDADGTANGVIELQTNYFAEPLFIEETVAPEGYLLPAPADRTQSLTASEYGTYTLTFVDPKPYKPLTVEKTAIGGYEVEYTWDIDKSVAVAGEDVDGEQITTAGDTTVGFDYTVAVDPLQRIVREVLVTGEITVNNPNDQPVVATLIDKLADGTSCTIDAADADPGTEGLQVELAAGESTFGYECAAEEEPAALNGSNEVTVAWDLGKYPQTQAQVDDPAAAGTASVSDTAEFEYEVTEINKTITILDDQHVFEASDAEETGWIASWDDPAENLSRTYSMEHQGQPGTCKEFSNTASVKEIPDLHDSTLVTLCSGADLLVSGELDLSFERDYVWGIDKNLLSEEPLVFDESGKAAAEYEVTVAPGTPVDSAWKVKGTVSVENPNDWEDVEVSIAQPAFSGLSTSTCTIEGTDGDLTLDGFQAVIPSGETLNFTYSCTVDAQPDYSGSSTAVVTWDATAASTTSGQGEYTATTYAVDDWSVTKHNETVTVVDDHHDFDPAWTITYEEGVIPPPHSYEVSWTYEQSENLCNEFTNIAQLFGDDPDAALDEDSVTVVGCLPADLSVVKSSDPASGSYVAPGSTVDYTLTFTNDGGVPAEVNYIDWLADVLDDATYNDGSLSVAGDGLTASIADGKIAIAGEVAAQESVTVTYSVTIKTEGFGNGVATNFLVPDGEVPPTVCDPEVSECTEHPILGTVNWAKTDEAGDALAQSEWELTGPDDFNDGAPLAIEDCIADDAADCTGADRDPAAGQFSVVHLPWGNYELRETKAPAGYYPMEKPLPFEIVDGELVKDLAGIENLRRESPGLPLTGGLGSDLYFLLGGSVAALGAVAYGLMKWRRRHSASS